MLLNLSAMAALVPASLQALRRSQARDAVYWAILALAVAGAVIRGWWLLAEPWSTGFAASLWITVVATVLIFAAVAILTPSAWRLTPLVAVTLLILAILATVWQSAPVGPPTADAGEGEGAWLAVHIAVSVVTYALVTLAALSAVASALQERALKRKRPTALSRTLPAMAECDGLVVRLLLLGEGVLAIGLATGMALLYRETGEVLAFDHKTVLTLAGFVVIAVLLLAHFWTGVRGRRAAQYVLIAWLLLTLGYPGVKFVTDVLIG